MIDSSKTIREMADEYAEITGENIYMGIENNGTIRKWLFSDGTFTNEKAAFEHMQTHLDDARANFI